MDNKLADQMAAHTLRADADASEDGTHGSNLEVGSRNGPNSKAASGPLVERCDADGQFEGPHETANIRAASDSVKQWRTWRVGARLGAGRARTRCC